MSPKIPTLKDPSYPYRTQSLKWVAVLLRRMYRWHISIGQRFGNTDHSEMKMCVFLA